MKCIQQFSEISKNVIFSIFLKMLKYLLYIKFQMFGVFKSHEQGCKHLHFNFTKKMHPKICFTRNDDFYIFEPKKCKMNENYSKTLLTYDPLKCSRLG